MNGACEVGLPVSDVVQQDGRLTPCHVKYLYVQQSPHGYAFPASLVDSLPCYLYMLLLCTLLILVNLPANSEKVRPSTFNLKLFSYPGSHCACFFWEELAFKGAYTCSTWKMTDIDVALFRSKDYCSLKNNQLQSQAAYALNQSLHS